MSQIEKLLEAQERALLRLEEREVREFLRAYNDSRRELKDRMEDAVRRLGSGSWTAQHTRVASIQVEAGIAALKRRLDQLLGRQVDNRAALSLTNLVRVASVFEPEFRGLAPALNVGAMRRLAASGELLLHRYSTTRYSAELIDRIQAEMVRAHASRTTRSQAIQRIVGSDNSVFSGMQYRGALIDRMENARAYDASFRAGLNEASEQLDEPGDSDPMLKKAVEFIDKRSHPFSAALDGRVAHVDGDYEVPAADVRAAAERMGKGISGILWREEGSTYKGAAYPAHFNDRGRSVPWRASWGSFKGEIPKRRRR